MKKEKNKGTVKKWLWNGGMLAALVAAVTVFVVMLEMEKRVLTQYERGNIYVATTKIPEGQLITKENYPEYFTEYLLDKRVIPKTAIISEEQVEGLVAREDIEEGVLLTTGMFERLDEITAALQEPVVAGLKAEDLYQMAGGILRAGDRIHIYSVNKENIATLVWKNVYVQQVFDSVGGKIPNEDEITAVQRINVYLDSKEVARFYSELAAGSLRVVKVCD